MAPLAVPESHQLLSAAATAAAAAAAHNWQLAPGQAMTLRARHASALVVTSGSAWVTLDGPHVGPLNNRGDVILQAGTRLPLAAGQSLVIEPLGGQGSAPLRLVWERQPSAYVLSGLFAIARGAALGALHGALAGARAARAA